MSGEDEQPSVLPAMAGGLLVGLGCSSSATAAAAAAAAAAMRPRRTPRSSSSRLMVRMVLMLLHSVVCFTWCSGRCVRGMELEMAGERGSSPDDRLGGGGGHGGVAPSRERNLRQQRPRRHHLRHFQSDVPDQPLQSPPGATAGAAVGTTGSAFQRNALSQPSEAYVNSSENCSSRMEYTITGCDFRNRQNVSWNYGDGDSALTCDTPLPEQTSIKCDHVARVSGEGIAIELLAGAGVVVSAGFWLALSRFRRSRTVRLGQPMLSKLFVVGIGITCLSVFALLGGSGGLTCALSLWGYSLGFDLAFGSLALKLWFALGAGASSAKFTRASLTTRKVVAMLGMIVAGDAAVLSRWTATLGDNCAAQYEPVGGAFVRRSSCIPCLQTLFWVWVVLKAVLVALSCFISFRARRVRKSISYSGGVGMATYNLGVAGLLVAAVLWAEANAQVRTTVEASAIVLAGVGSLFSILGPKVLRAKKELEGKALVGPSPVIAGSGSDGSGGSGGGGSGDAQFFGGSVEDAVDEEMKGGGEDRPRTLTPSGLSAGDDGSSSGGGTGNAGSGISSSNVLSHGDERRRRRRQPSEPLPVSSGGGSGVPKPVDMMLAPVGSNRNATLDEMVYGDMTRSIPSPLSPKEAAAFATATAAAALEDAGDSTNKRHPDRPKPKAPAAASVICSRPHHNNHGGRSGGGGGGGTNGGHGKFATTGGTGGKGLVVPDPSGFLTPPRRRVGRTRSSVEISAISVRSADGMALAARAAGRQGRYRGSGSLVEAAAAAGDDRRGGRGGVRNSTGSQRNHTRDIGGVGAGGWVERISSAAPLSALGIGEGRQQRGRTGSGGARARPTRSVASGSSRASRASSSGGDNINKRSRSQNPTNKRSSSSNNKRGTSSCGSVGGEDSISVLSSRDSGAFDPITMGMNGHGFGPGDGGGGSAWKTSFGAGAQRGSAGWSSMIRRRGASRDRASSLGRSSNSSGGRGKRSSAAGSLVMHMGTGTALHCPHCDKEVAGCGFKGCSGSLVRQPSFSDEEFGPEPFVGPPVPPPLLPPLVPASSAAFPLPAIGGGFFPPATATATATAAAAAATATGGGVGSSSASASGLSSVATGPRGKLLSPAANAAAVPAAPVATAPAHKTSTAGSVSRLRMSFRRGKSAHDTFDNDSDSDRVGGGGDDEDSFCKGNESQRSNPSNYSPSSWSNWG
ncbi:unnamed protein product [Pylaiella littoralis]